MLAIRSVKDSTYKFFRNRETLERMAPFNGNDSTIGGQAIDSAILDRQAVYDDQLKCGESKNRRPDPGLDHSKIGSLTPNHVPFYQRLDVAFDMYQMSSACL